MTHNCPSVSALLVDGTALYQASRLLSNDPLDYRAFLNVLQQGSEVQSFEPVIFYTSFTAENEGQVRFLDFLKRTLGWVIDPVHPTEAAFKPPIASLHNPESGGQPAPWFRFDARVAFALGRLAGQRENVVVVSDSYALLAPMLETAKRGTRVFLAFFGQLLDPRFRKYLPGSTHATPASPLKWIDLDICSINLFRRTATQEKLETNNGLVGLP